jgi:predicted GIY-YIG superfamily endonuclease
MFVYLIKSTRNKERTYVGLTEDFDRRFAEHNDGKSPVTYKFRPWKCVVKIWFDDPDKAKAFESYLKSGSGRAFSSRHLW